MDDDRKNKTDRVLILTAEQLKAVFKWVFEDINYLHRGIFRLLDIMNDPVISDLFDQYPQLLEKYELDELLSGKIQIEYTDIAEVQRAVLLGVLQSLILCGQQLYVSGQFQYGVVNNDHIDVKMLRFVLRFVPLVDLLKSLEQLLCSVVGAGYYKTFVEQVLDSSENTLPSVTNPKEYYHLMMWFGVVRAFLNAVNFWLEMEEKS